MSTGAGHNTCKKLGDVKDRAPIKIMADTPPEEKAKKLGDTMGDVKAEWLVDTLPHSLPPAKNRNKPRQIRPLRADAVKDSMAENLQEAKTKTPLKT